jgi:FkbM family methyltransferase
MRSEDALGFSDLPAESVVELPTSIGVLWFDQEDRLITPLVAEYADWEGDVHAFLRNSLTPGMTFVDIGANVGFFSVIASKLVGSSGRVVAVEPLARNIALLKANLWRHGCTNATIYPLAAYSHTGVANLLSNPDGGSGSWIEEEETAETSRVACARLDDLLGADRIDVMKIDIERSEHIAIQGAEDLIRRSQRLAVVAEFCPGQEQLGGEFAPSEVLDYY